MRRLTVTFYVEYMVIAIVQIGIKIFIDLLHARVLVIAYSTYQSHNRVIRVTMRIYLLSVTIGMT